MRIIALDVHRSFAQTAILESGKLRDAGKIDLEYRALVQTAKEGHIPANSPFAEANSDAEHG